MNASNYPPGVSGNEPEIVGGADYEWNEEQYCERCKERTTFECSEVQVRRRLTDIVCKCMECGYLSDYYDEE